MYSAEEKIKWFAVTSRVFLFSLQCFGNYWFIDHNPKVFKKPLLLKSDVNEFPDAILDFFTSGLTRWDGQYFLHIAEYGYTYENTLAFFPLFPLIIRSLGLAFQFAINNVFYFASLPLALSTHNAIVLMALVFNVVMFVHSSLLLFKLTLRVTDNEKIAYASALLFCVNPASIFFSAAYSEVLFCFLTLNAMMYVELGHILTGSVLVGLSAMTRSNGLANVGYIVYRLLKTRRNAYSFLLTFIVFIACLLISLFPFVVFQFYGFTKFCYPLDYHVPELLVAHARKNDYVLPGNGSRWCHDPLPLSYGFIQQHYWNVGFLKYYEIKQIPNFMLALPVISLTLFGAYHFVKSHGFVILWLGLVPGSKSAVLPTSCFPYVAHACFLAFFGAFFMHVQVTTRMLFSSCPVLYWYGAEVLLKYMPESKEALVARRLSKKPNAYYEPQSNRSSKWKTILLSERFVRSAVLIRYYFFSYFLAGTVIFANNLPWT